MENFKKIQYHISLITLAYATTFSSQTSAGAEDGFSNAPQPIDVPTDLEAVLMNATNYILGLIVMIATLIIIYGGVLYLTSMGNEERRSQAMKTISSGIIGVIIIGLAYALVIAVVNILNQE